MKFGEANRGKAIANYVLAEAADGYCVVFALPEWIPRLPISRFFLMTGVMVSRWAKSKGTYGL